MAHDDDVETWDDDPLVRALRAPGTAAELAGQDEALAAFRVAVPRRSGRRRLARRMGTGAGTLVIAVALSGGVAAAYTHTLPDPVQRVAHSWFGDLGVGPPTAGRAVPGHVHPRPAHGPGPGTPAAPATHGSGTPTHAPSTAPSVAAAPAASRRAHPATRPSPAPSRSPRVKAPAHPAPVTSPTPSPTPSGPVRPRLRPAAVTAIVSAQRIPPGSSVTVSGQLTTSSGAPVPDRRVVVQTRPAGQHQGWSAVTSASTDSSGDVTLDVPALSRTTRVRLKAHRVHSSVSTVVVLPTLAASVTREGAQYAVTVTSTGLQPGDTLNVVRRRRGHRAVVTRVTVDSSGGAGFTVGVPRRRDVTFRVVTRRTNSHAGARTTFVAPRA